MDMEVVMAGGVRGQRAGPAMGVGGTVQKGAGGAQPDPTVTPCPQGTCWRSHWPWWTATTPTSASAAPGAATQDIGTAGDHPDGDQCVLPTGRPPAPRARCLPGILLPAAAGPSRGAAKRRGEAFQEHPGRRWLDGFLWAPDGPPGQGLFVDTFRLLHPSQPYAFTCWRIDTGARLTNHGTRLDYVLADRALALAELRDARILPEVPGSDHCPVLAELAATFLPAPHCPPLCTRHMPEFAGTQQKLSRFLVRVEPGAGAAGVHRTCRGAGVGRGCSARRGRRLPRGQGDLLRYFRAAQGQLGTGMGQNGQELDQNASGHGTQELAQDALGQRGQEAAHSAPGQGRQLELTMGQAAGTQLSSTAHWRMVLCGPTLPPCCPGHREPCALRTVRKPGPNRGRRFYICARPPGRRSDPRARCDFFRWAGKGRS
ncbi:DNA-(apurinic or apyrimidinic site) lyase 2 isoform X7 [Gopherus evgoodei]|uniref:DNA-(apurinic or apyrimidinic site) lyase 2 isoform X7 n=1 Tax=Gopherus evgoodei TaxID=1825980 RepID=UPI0011CF428B|nr:DNA-(apurinic or apyrimidinic site) lyase 2 isoform X7 [Gopherus evgoodei]